MIAVRLAFTLCFFVPIWTSARADALNDQLHAVGIEGRSDLTKPAAARLSVKPSELGAISNPITRSNVAMDLAVRRGLADVADGNWAATTPDLQLRARELLLKPTVITAVQKDPMLSLNVAWRIPSKYGIEMVGGEFTSRPGGGTAPVVRQPQSPIGPIPASLLIGEPTANAPPDLGHLPFPVTFVMELRVGNMHCSGALIRSDLVLTARHCLLNEDGSHADGSQVSVRSTAGGPVVKGLPGPARSLEPPPDQPSQARYRDLAVLTLSVPYPGQIAYAQIAPATTEELWVVMAGVGYTDVSALSLAGWNPSYFARQAVNFGAFSSNVPALAAIPWDNTRGDHASQCAGDSGGPVFVVGRAGTPLIVGVLSRSTSGEPNSVAGCAVSGGAVFINLGHPFVQGLMCQHLQSLGVDCRAPIDYVKRDTHI